MSSGGRRELRLIRISRSNGTPAVDTVNRETLQTPQRRSANADQMIVDDLMDNINLDDIRRMMAFGGPPPTPAEVSPSQVSPSHPTQQTSRGRGRNWFSSLQILRRRGRSRRPSPNPPSHSHDPLHLSPYAIGDDDGDEASSTFGPQPAERENISPPLYRSYPLPRRTIQHLAETAEDGFWVLDDIWMDMDVGHAPRGILGALQGRMRQQRLWLSEDEDRWTYEELLELDADNVRRGLKQKEFNKLERTQQRGSDAKLDCQICMSETCTGDEIAKLPCSHSYHEACITPWLRSHRTCPVCRYEFPG